MASIATHRLDIGDDYKDYNTAELQEPDIMFLAIYPGQGIPNAFNDHYEILGCESLADEPYLRAVVRVRDPYQRTLLALQIPELDKRSILGDRDA